MTPWLSNSVGGWRKGSRALQSGTCQVSPGPRVWWPKGCFLKEEQLALGSSTFSPRTSWLAPLPCQQIKVAEPAVPAQAGTFLTGYECSANDIIFLKSFTRTRIFPCVYLNTSYLRNSCLTKTCASRSCQKGVNMFQCILKAERRKYFALDNTIYIS